VVLLREEVVELAYPFATGPNRFAVTLGDGRVRYACCAIDALGLAPMLGAALTARGICHGSGLPLVFGVTRRDPRRRRPG
jgi:Alkylmercury lyase